MILMPILLLLCMVSFIFFHIHLTIIHNQLLNCNKPVCYICICYKLYVCLGLITRRPKDQLVIIITTIRALNVLVQSSRNRDFNLIVYDFRT